MRRCAATVLVALMLIAGCGGGRSDGIFDPGATTRFDDSARKAVQADIAELAKGKDPADIEGSAAYSAAVDRLTARGAAIEPQLIEALGGDPDWAVRMGAIEVLASVGTRACVDALVAAVRDPAPLVSLHADKLLQAMLGHRVIPAAGEPATAEGLPPVPARDPAVLDLDAEERLWTAWHAEHRQRLGDAWAAWWSANKKQATVR